MNNCALICEYNPFHTGHAYQLGKIREHGADNIVCVMSGNFTQNGLPAFCDKRLRATCAIDGGADAVIELPTVYATSSAMYFATGAIKIIAGIRDITTLAMGVVAPPDTIMRLADIKISHKAEFEAALRKHIADGKGYNGANIAAFDELCDKYYNPNSGISLAIADPNNMLAVEYISALAEYAANISPLPILRIGAPHGDMTVNAEYISASAIRAASARGNIDAVTKYLPCRTFEIMQFAAEHSPNIAVYKKIAVYALKSTQCEKLSELRDCSEGIEYRLKKINSNDFDDIIAEAECKRYGKKRIQRLLLDAVLSITREMLDKRFCTRLLARKKDFDVSLLPNNITMRNSDITRAKRSDAEICDTVDLEERATTLYNTLCGIDGGYYNYETVII